MSLAIAANRPPSLAVVGTLAKVIPFPFKKTVSKPSLEITVPDFHFKFSTSISEIESGNVSSDIIFKASLYDSIDIVINLTGELVERDGFRVIEVSVNTEFEIARARAEFIASTFLSTIGLAENVRLRIPEIELDLELQFQSSLSEISVMLQRRQMAYRLMVIERATGYEFEAPVSLSSAEMENLALVYYAIVERSFIFPFSTVTYPVVPATEEYLQQFASLEGKSSIVFGPEPLSKTLLGKTISLGNDSTWIIENAAIDRFDEVKKELARGDGHPVEIVIRSLSGQARYNLPTAPRLPDNPWDSEIQKLIELESDLDARLVERYHVLAAATLAGLTDEEKKIATARPELDIDISLPM